MSRFALAWLAVAFIALLPVPKREPPKTSPMEHGPSQPMEAPNAIHPRFTLQNGAPYAPSSFVNKVAFYNNQIWLGTFDGGLVSLRATPAEVAAHPERLRDATSIDAPMRMVNDVIATSDALFVAANEGLFFTRDGAHFERLDNVARGATGMASDGDHVFVTTTSAVWRIRLRAKRRPLVDGNWWLAAGSRALQGIALSGKTAWIASEDRGVISFDPTAVVPKFVAVDRLSGAPSSWVIAVAGDGQGGVFGATLRDGVFHVDGADHPKIEQVVGVPNSWSESVSFDGTLCVGSQAGAACWKDWREPPSLVFGGLPDARVHAMAKLGDAYLLGTEGGIALADATPAR